MSIVLEKKLAEKLSRKDGESYAITWLRIRFSFEILRSVHISVRGSRVPFRSANNFLEDLRLNINAAGVLKRL